MELSSVPLSLVHFRRIKRMHTKLEKFTPGQLEGFKNQDEANDYKGEAEDEGEGEAFMKEKHKKDNYKENENHKEKENHKENENHKERREGEREER